MILPARRRDRLFAPLYRLRLAVLGLWLRRTRSPAADPCAHYWTEHHDGLFECEACGHWALVAPGEWPGT